jgi:hypothetical protein
MRHLLLCMPVRFWSLTFRDGVAVCRPRARGARLHAEGTHRTSHFIRERLMLGAVMLGVASAGNAQAVPALPVPVANAALASGVIDGETWLFSALGIDSTKRWSGITRRAHAWSPGSTRWRALPDVPGTTGRLAATAQVVRGRLFVFGGYTVDSAGAERSVASVDIYEPRLNLWSRGSDMPVSVDDAVSVVYRDSLIYLISGWHDTANVQLVQMYDAVRDAWFPASPVVGRGVFGHSGGIVGNTIVYVDGAVKQDSATKYALHRQVWIGTIDKKNPSVIGWRAGAAHPGPPLYRAAVGRCGSQIVFAGGTDNPYNYNGIGYDNRPSQPSLTAFGFDTRRGAWQTLPALTAATMDHRGMAVLESAGWLIGGMAAGQRVTGAALAVPLKDCRK